MIYPDDEFDELLSELDSLEARDLFRQFNSRESDDIS